VDDKLGKMWRGSVVVQFEAICRHRTGGAEENHKILNLVGARAEIRTEQLVEELSDTAGSRYR
jgi:hypothetical protein